MTTEAWEPVDYLTEYRQRHTDCAEMIDLLKQRAKGADWEPHLPQMIEAIDFFRGLLEDEIDHFGEWRYHGFQPDEVLDILDEDLEGLAAWLCRMTGDIRR